MLLEGTDCCHERQRDLPDFSRSVRLGARPRRGSEFIGLHDSLRVAAIVHDETLLMGARVLIGAERYPLGVEGEGRDGARAGARERELTLPRLPANHRRIERTHGVPHRRSGVRARRAQARRANQRIQP
jgi:hypothetical protein